MNVTGVIKGDAKSLDYSSYCTPSEKAGVFIASLLRSTLVWGCLGGFRV